MLMASNWALFIKNKVFRELMQCLIYFVVSYRYGKVKTNYNNARWPLRLFECRIPLLFIVNLYLFTVQISTINLTAKPDAGHFNQFIGTNRLINCYLFQYSGPDIAGNMFGSNLKLRIFRSEWSRTLANIWQGLIPI